MVKNNGFLSIIILSVAINKIGKIISGFIKYGCLASAKRENALNVYVKVPIKMFNDEYFL